MKNKKRRKIKKKVKKQLIKFLIFSCIILVIIIIMLFLSHLLKPKYATEAIEFNNVDEIMVFNEIIDINRQNRPGHTREIKYIVIHETGNFSQTATALNHSDYLLTNLDDQNSWHYTVDENEIFHHLPDNEVGWHSSDGLNKNGGNLNGIGIEICVNEGSDYDKTVDNCARLVAKLIKLYKLDIDAVKTHNDFSGKDCPKQLLEDNNWDEFIETVEKYMK